VVVVFAQQKSWQEFMPCKPGDKRPCGSNIGICEQGERHCIDGKWSEECIGGKGPQEEICDNGLDDDCDGIVDECVDITQSFGIFLIIGGVILFIIGIILSRIM